jgi:WhiB family redox-sensing transcriptional regulator
MQPPPDAIALDPLEVFGLRRPSWWSDAACRGVGAEVFYVERGGDTGPARRLCAGCLVRAECLADVMTMEAGQPRALRHGIRAGLSPGQRVELERQGRQAA